MRLEGTEIIESLRGYTSGFAVPTQGVDPPGGGGRIPLTPSRLVSVGVNEVVLRNDEGVITTHHGPDDPGVQPCYRDCASCRLSPNVNAAFEHQAVGLERLLSAWDDTGCVTPEETDRMDRRDEEVPA